jgi:hypothetical protein
VKNSTSNTLKADLAQLHNTFDDLSNTLDGSKPFETSGVNDIKITDCNNSKYVNTAGESTAKRNKKTRFTGKRTRRMKLKEENLNQDSKSGTCNIIEEPFHLNEMVFKQREENSDLNSDNKISDAAKTFRNLRNQLISQNRSRVPMNLQKMRSESNKEEPKSSFNLNPNSRNQSDLRVNSLSPKSSTLKQPMFDKREIEGSSPSNCSSRLNELNSATTLYVETMSNK